MSRPAPDAAPPLHRSPWSPLARPVFRSLWIAALASNVGTWMQDVAAAWLMTSLTPSPLLIALIQAATTLPIFLLAIVGGALADVVDRRRLLLVTQTWMLLASAGLGLATLAGRTTEELLLLATFAVGVGAALNAPAWQAIIPELVERDELTPALALNGIGINLARAAGPALGGAIVAAFGAGAAFLLNAASFLGVVVVLHRWRRPARRSPLPPESLPGAMAAGLRYARHAPELRAVLLRAFAFIVPASALWALLPALVRFDLGRGPVAYGFVLGCLGAGAVAGALQLPRLRRVLELDRLVATAAIVFAAALLVLGAIHNFAVVACAMAAAGGAWIVLMTSFHSAAQGALAPWVRGRGLAVYLLVFFGGMAGGSAAWGAVAAATGVRPALVAASAAVVITLAATWRVRLPEGAGIDLAPSRHWPAPIVVDGGADGGPVLVTVEYRIDPARAAEFAQAMREVRRIRLRDGAVRWDLLTDAADPARWVETFFVPSWVEHLRQHERITVADREVERRARQHHVGSEPPRVSHFVGRDVPR